MSLFVKKSLTQMLAQANDDGKGMKRTLGAGNLIALGMLLIGNSLQCLKTERIIKKRSSVLTIGF